MLAFFVVTPLSPTFVKGGNLIYDESSFQEGNKYIKVY